MVWSRGVFTGLEHVQIDLYFSVLMASFSSVETMSLIDVLLAPEGLNQPVPVRLESVPVRLRG